MTKLRAGLSALLLALVAVWAVALPAAADDSAPITRYHQDVTLTEDGVAKVTVNMTMDFGAKRGRGPILVFPTRQDDGKNPDEQYVFNYSNFRVSSPTGASAQVARETESDAVALRIGSENRFNNSPEDYVISYEVTGFIVSDHPESGMDEFNWNAIGPAATSTFRDVQVTVTGPAQVQKAACFYGRSYTRECQSSESGNTATFAVDALGTREPMQVVAGFPAGTFGGVQQEKARKVTMENAFELTPVSGGLAGAGLLAALAALFAIQRRHARDDVYLGLTPGLTPAAGEKANVGPKTSKFPVTVQFHPPKGATPGEVGTLMDTTADNVDVSATMVDLAVRGFMRIESDGRDEFVLHAMPSRNRDQLNSYEQRLLADIFQGAPSRSSRELSKAKFQDVLPNARTGLYNAVVQKGWFKSNPTTAQMAPLVGGALAIGAGIFAAMVLSQMGLGLVSIPLFVLGIGLIMMSGKFRKRTAQGSAYLAQAKGFELYLRTAEKETLRFEEGEDIFSKYLPYAMVFGVADRWSKLFAQLGAEGIYRADTSWYIGADLMHGYYFANAMNNLSHSMSDAMQSARMDGMSAATGGSSGFSGFSGGGGFGGGSVGSW